MSPAQHEEVPAPTLRDLYPDFTDEELKLTEERLDRYLEECLESFEDIVRDPGRYARLEALTAAFWRRRMGIVTKDGKTNPNL